VIKIKVSRHVFANPESQRVFVFHLVEVKLSPVDGDPRHGIPTGVVGLVAEDNSLS